MRNGQMGPGVHNRGFSMEMLGSPYMLPPGLHGSRESLHSMTRSMRDQHDPYRPVAFARSSTDTSRARSPHPFNENASTYSGSTMHHGYHEKSGYHESSNLVNNAQMVSQSFPERGISLARLDTQVDNKSSRATSPMPTSGANDSATPSRETSMTSTENTALEKKSSQSSLPPIPASPYHSTEHDSEPPRTARKDVPAPPVHMTSGLTPPPRLDSAKGAPQIQVDDQLVDDWDYFEADDEAAPPPPPHFFDEPEQSHYDPNVINNIRYSMDNAVQYEHTPPQENRLSVMGLRPLPPDHPEEAPEQRANRIRSFYKEYFDASKPVPQNAYYEDYDNDYTAEYYDGWYDPDSNGYYYNGPQQPAPWAAPVQRRAMTPPPRGAAPRFQGHHDRHYSTMSGGRGPFRGRAPPQAQKKLPPPKSLKSVPSAHLLKSDAALFEAGDFAPPTSYRDMQNGRRADSPLGSQRPFSPSVKAFSPLVSSFQGLSPLPSPHSLRKSGTFTSLDFTPQTPRFRGFEGGTPGGSDVASIRSARSGISAMHVDAMRAGAYRASRIPKEFVTLREDLRNQLKPSMNLTRAA